MKPHGDTSHQNLLREWGQGNKVSSGALKSIERSQIEQDLFMAGRKSTSIAGENPHSRFQPASSSLNSNNPFLGT